MTARYGSYRIFSGWQAIGIVIFDSVMRVVDCLDTFAVPFLPPLTFGTLKVGDMVALGCSNQKIHYVSVPTIHSVALKDELCRRMVRLYAGEDPVVGVVVEKWLPNSVDNNIDATVVAVLTTEGILLLKDYYVNISLLTIELQQDVEDSSWP